MGATMKVMGIRKTGYDHVLNKFNIVFNTYGLSRGTAAKSELDNFSAQFAATKPDFLYFFKDEQLKRNFLLSLKKISPKTKFVMFYGDQRGCVPTLIQKRADILDALLINNEDPNQFKMYNAAGIKNVFTFHHGVPVNEFKDFDIPISNNVFFGGNNFNHNKFPLGKLRYDLITRVHKLFGLLVYGAGWPFKTEKAVPRHQYARVLRRAHINLGINHYTVPCYYNRRLFECLGSGKVHVTYYIPGMEKHFKNHTHLVWFQTIKQGLDAIQNLLKYPEKREAIAAAGKKLVFEQHSFEVRALQFKNILERL